MLLAAATAAVFLFPMCREDAHDGWTPVVEQLRAAGLQTVVVDEKKDAEAALAELPADVPFAVAGSSCGVFKALNLASRHPQRARAAVALAGPHTAKQLDFVHATPSLAVFSGASDDETPAVEWARALNAASQNKASRLVVIPGEGHGTDLFGTHPDLAKNVATWLVAQLKGNAQ